MYMPFGGCFLNAKGMMEFWITGDDYRWIFTQHIFSGGWQHLHPQLAINIIWYCLIVIHILQSGKNSMCNGGILFGPSLL